MQHFYDQQIRRYLTQMVRMLSGFSYMDGKGNLTQVPVMYGDLTRQVGSILRDNSENKIPSAPRMAVYITELAMDTTRLSDSSYVNKLNIRERAVDANGVEYLRKEGKNYTVERLMPTPYDLTVNVDIWTTNTDQKLQIMEQILMLFNPSLEIQTTDNYIDWTSLSVVNLENVSWSNRSIPTGTESEIDVATLTFKTPIYISPPVKVKKLGVITNIITAIFNDNGLEINLDDSAYAQSLVKDAPVNYGKDYVPNKLPGKREALTSETTLVATSHNNYDLVFINGIAKLLGKGTVGAETWTGFIKALPEVFQSGITELRLQRTGGYEIVGTVAINTADETELIVNLDPDTLPDDTLIAGRTGIDYIIDPTKKNPNDFSLSSNPRILILNNIGNTATQFKEYTLVPSTTIFAIDTDIPYQVDKLVKDPNNLSVTKRLKVDQIYDVLVNIDGSDFTDFTYENNGGNLRIVFTNGYYAQPDAYIRYTVEFISAYDGDDSSADWTPQRQDGADAWKNLDGSDFFAKENDIVEWNGSRWNIVFRAASTSTETFVTNDNTGTQYKWTGDEWVLSYEGEYPDGTWRLAF